MVRSPLSASTSAYKSKPIKDIDINLKPDTTPVVIRSYSRDKLITTLLAWYKKHPHPENPKTTAVRKFLKKELVTQVLQIQKMMCAEAVANDFPSDSPKSVASLPKLNRLVPWKLRISNVSLERSTMNSTASASCFPLYMANLNRNCCIF